MPWVQNPDPDSAQMIWVPDQPMGTPQDFAWGETFRAPPPAGVSQQWLATPEGQQYLLWGGRPPEQQVYTPEMREGEAVRQVNEAFGGRSGIYDQVRDSNFGLQKGRLDQEREKSLRSIKFMLAGQGLNGGSADIDAHGNEQRIYTRALQDVSQQAQGAADQVRANDEKTRLNLIGQIRSGMDSASASESAARQMADNVNAARANLTFGAVDSYLGTVAPIYQAHEYTQGRMTAQNQRGAGGYSPAGQYNGTISRL